MATSNIYGNVAMDRMMKKCNSCSVVKEINEFGIDRSRKDGRSYYCLTCKGAVARKAQKKYKQTQKGKETEKRWRRGDAGKLSKTRYPKRYKAHQIVFWAIRRGDLKKQSECDCVLCGKQASQYHHDDYSKPLEVTPVCSMCHSIIHKRRKE